jgi:hypothetical protein
MVRGRDLKLAGLAMALRSASSRPVIVGNSIRLVSGAELGDALG